MGRARRAGRPRRPRRRARRRPGLDRDRLGVLGGSYGGYLTTWLVAHTDRFAARNGSPRHRIQRAELILDFFGRHLGGARPEADWLR
ncbi:prolyl oligopeptidase family serine peptidase [Pseudonocardia oceani]|uniref:prolyl oligopeptidase family serine peptidase n=1 Tax=Pseudonocardia oceani TaxID=2792013 RepID=UPI001CECF3E7|nr:prolyl oligopeptidase family serine peptidase [Pseudonocardia oceani]